MAKEKKPKPKPLLPLEQAPRKPSKRCIHCEYHRKALSVCCESVGPANADIMIVGEAPGEQEDRKGKPFVGDSGRKLQYIFERIGMKRKEVFLTNIARCRPSKNDKPKKKQIMACAPHLLYEILKVQPKAIVTMGATALETVTGQPNTKHNGLSSRRGFPKRQTFKWESPAGKVYRHECWVIPTYHPSAALREGGWIYDDLIAHDLSLAMDYAAGKQTLQMPKTRVVVAKELSFTLKLIEKMKEVGRFVVDAETTGLDPNKDEVLCLGFCWRAGEAWIIPFLGQNKVPIWDEQDLKVLVAALVDLFLSAEIIGQGIKFDLKFICRLLGIELAQLRVVFDTMVAHHCIDENKLHNLTSQCQWYLRWERYDEVMLQYYDHDEAQYWLAPDEVLWNYCGYDVDGEFQLAELHTTTLKKEKLVTAFKTEMGLIMPLADVELQGVRVDIDKMKEKVTDAQKSAEEALAWLRMEAAKTLPEGAATLFNPASTQQLSAWLIDLGVPLSKKTKKGNISTGKNVMSALALQDNVYGEIATKIKQFREANKLLGTYLDGSSLQGGKEGAEFKQEGGGFLKYVDEAGRIYPTYHSSRTVTGRLSATDPAVQTIPRLHGLRNMLVPDFEDDVFISCDYSKAELCVMAWLANDEVMARELISNVDLHARMAITIRLNRDPTDEEFATMLPVCQEEPMWKHERGLAKTCVFGAAYGRSAKGIVEAFPESYPDEMSEEERIRSTQKIIDGFFSKYYGVREYMDKQIKLAQSKGKLRTQFTGRVRRLTGMDWFFNKHAFACRLRNKDLEQLNRESMNFNVQSTASDELSKATARIYQYIQKVKVPHFRIVLTLHDQLLFNCHKDYAEAVIPAIKERMEVTFHPDKRHKFEVPLKIDPSIQIAWGLYHDNSSEY